MANKGNRDVYERLWSGGWRSSSRTAPGASYRTRRRLFLSCFRSVYRPGARVLDVGCGNGSLLADIARRHPDVGPLLGTDIAEAALEVAREAVPAAEMFCCDPQTGPIPIDEPCDIVLSCEVLEHVDDPESVVAQMRDALRPGGALVMSVPHSMKHWGPHDEAVHHVRRLERDEVTELLTDAGLHVERMFTWGSVLYDIYYRALLNQVSTELTWKPKSWLMRRAHDVLYTALFLDDLFINVGTGRMLFAVARRTQ